MAGLAKTTKAIKAVNKRKKHGKKAGQKSLVRPSQKKSVKNGRHQEKETPKKKIAKAVASIPAGLDGQIMDDEFEEELVAAEFNDEFLDDSFDDEIECPAFDEDEAPFDVIESNLDGLEDHQDE